MVSGDKERGAPLRRRRRHPCMGPVGPYVNIGGPKAILVSD